MAVRSAQYITEEAGFELLQSDVERLGNVAWRASSLGHGQPCMAHLGAAHACHLANRFA